MCKPCVFPFLIKGIATYLTPCQCFCETPNPIQLKNTPIIWGEKLRISDGNDKMHFLMNDTKMQYFAKKSWIQESHFADDLFLF